MMRWTVMLTIVAIVTVLGLVMLWLQFKSWRRHRAFERALKHPAVLCAVQWWAAEMQRAAEPYGITVEQTCRFRASLVRVLAAASASNPDRLYQEDLGPLYPGHDLIMTARYEAQLAIPFSFPVLLRMRFHRDQVLVSRSIAEPWKAIWRQPQEEQAWPEERQYAGGD